MHRQNRIQKLLTPLMIFAMIGVSSNFALAQAGDMAEISVTGTVSVNGENAVSGSTIVTNSQIVTGANSSAIINLGSRGKVEVLPGSTVNLKFTERSIVVMLNSGSVRIMNAAGIGATVNTRTATAVAETGRSNSFVVSLGCEGDDECQETFVETAAGLVTLQSINNTQTLKQVPAGAKTGSGEGCSKTCAKPGILPIELGSGVSNGLLAAIFGGIGAAVLAGLLVGNPTVETIGDITVVSPNS